VDECTPLFVGFLCILIAAPFTFYVARLLFVLRKRLVRCADGKVLHSSTSQLNLSRV
jgi:hypothetical protein